MAPCRVSLQKSAVLENRPSVPQIKLSLDNYSVLGLYMLWKSYLNYAANLRIVSSKLWKTSRRKIGSNEPWKLQIFMFLITDAILEGAQKQCSDRITDGEELRNSYILSVASQHFSIASVCLQGHSRKRCLRWLILTSGFESRNSYGLHPVASV